MTQTFKPWGSVGKTEPIERPASERPKGERSSRTAENVQFERSERERSSAERSPIERYTASRGYLQIPNTVLDSVLPTLDPREQVVFLRLYRLSWGYGKAECTVSVPKLAERTKVKRTCLFATLARLESLGLIERLKSGRGREEGTRFRVRRFQDEDTERSDSERSQVERPKGERSAGAPLKGKIEKKEVNAPVAGAPALDVYAVRTIAARLVEAGYPRDELHAQVRAALIAQGHEPDERLIAEAIG